MFDVSIYVDCAFNKVITDLILTLDEIEETDTNERIAYITAELVMFFERASNIYRIQAELTGDGETAAQLGKISEQFNDISDAFADLSKEEIGMFLVIYNPETSTDVFGCISSSKVL